MFAVRRRSWIFILLDLRQRWRAILPIARLGVVVRRLALRLRPLRLGRRMLLRIRMFVRLRLLPDNRGRMLVMLPLLWLCLGPRATDAEQRSREDYGNRGNPTDWKPGSHTLNSNYL